MLVASISCRTSTVHYGEAEQSMGRRSEDTGEGWADVLCALLPTAWANRAAREFGESCRHPSPPHEIWLADT